MRVGRGAAQIVAHLGVEFGGWKMFEEEKRRSRVPKVFDVGGEF
jgi:hypothetical protein